MNKIWSDKAWDDYLYWQMQDKKTLRCINQLIKDIERGHFEGLGKPEPLKHDYAGWWSRRIDEYNRLIYRIKNNQIELAQCGAHYRDK
ncbi:MAG: Txe/YoeB family addiction module toxin [Candidatus Margulisbacteria bacterium]|jgi:toxin YoeB|nr:Txe/YoeB family addiction module toxin [Candidatus Margulisiibacteriota bacterium]